MSTKKKKIGIPRVLFYYYYYPFCKCFFEELGFDVVVSPKTNRDILQKGLDQSSNELCIPIKLLYGHVLALKDKVDYIFLPYMISTHEGSYLCPKLIGSPDIIKANIDGLNLVSIDVDMNRFYSSLLSSVKELTMKLGINPLRIYPAYVKSVRIQKEFNYYIKKGIFFDDALRLIQQSKTEKTRFLKRYSNEKYKLTIAIIGHPYVFYNDYLSVNLFKKLKDKNVRIVTSEAIPDELVLKLLKKINIVTHWNLGNHVVAGTLYYSRKKEIDGIIYITPFGCSSDSLIREYAEACKGKKPYMVITVDEHSGDAGVVTRIEAFLDMIERKK